MQMGLGRVGTNILYHLEKEIQIGSFEMYYITYILLARNVKINMGTESEFTGRV